MKNIPRLMSSPGQISNLTNRDGKNRQANVLARALVPLLPSKALVRFLSSEPKPVVFMIVRHPFDRLLSAFRDKLERYNKVGTGHWAVNNLVSWQGPVFEDLIAVLL